MEPPPPPPPPPSSPGVSPIKLKECMEELLKFTLLSSIQGKLQTGLSDEYCDGLLRDDPSNLLPITNETCKGVPSYPLYKRVASSLYESIILEHRLQHVLNEVDFELHVQEPFFSQLNDGFKTVEGRVTTRAKCMVVNMRNPQECHNLTFILEYSFFFIRTEIQSGHLLLFNKCLILEVQDVRYYTSFHDMLQMESLAKVLPGVPSIEEGVQIYRNFYSEEKERSNGVIAICVTKPTSQLYVIMASILSGLSCGGVQKLLGFVKGSTLTNGARALSKHINRSSQGYWGALYGNDFEKNRQAVEVINRVLSECIWMNMHIVQPHGCIFEIRTRDGYGARWSGDGIKFIGFLEPYVVDGHSKGWKH
ncbi:hypothetical protein ACP275_07G098100 [Erythranthe tilingii]